MTSFKSCFGTSGTSALLLLALGMTSAQAAAPVHNVPAQSERLVYNIMVGGLHLGDAMIGLRQNGNGYNSEMRITARGVAKWMRDFRSDMRGEGAFIYSTATALTPKPARYRRQWTSGEIAADMTMTFDPATGTAIPQERHFNPATGEAIAREDLPWNKGERERERDRDRDAPADMRTNVLDPMAAFIAARGQIMAQGLSGTTAGTFRVPIFDGRRRYDIVGKTEAPRTVTVGGVERSVIPVVARLEPLHGFGRRSQERMRDSQGRFLFSNDARFIPLQLTVSNELLSGVMNLTVDCSQDASPCDTFGQTKEE